MLALTLALSLALQDPADALKKEVEALRKENADLREQMGQLEQATLEDARTIQRLRQALRLMESAGPAEKPPAPRTSPRTEPPGPHRPIKAKVVYVDPQNNFITLSIGQREGVLPGYRFEIYRESYPPGGSEPKLDRLGVAEFEKFMDKGAMSKLNVVEGKASDMRPDDIAVAIRKLDPVPAAPVEPAPAAPNGAAPPVPKEGVYSITGRAGIGAGAGYIVNYGSSQGARQTDLLYVYRDGTFKAKLRLDRVDKSFSIANVVDGSQEAPPEQGDQVFTQDLKKAKLSGRIALSDAKLGKLAVDLKQRDGMKPGMRLEVRRQGQKIGMIVITEVQSWGSWAKPEADAPYEAFQRNDFVEVIE